jgi:cytochrome c biogenesis protein CcdA/glutaredoxin
MVVLLGCLGALAAPAGPALGAPATSAAADPSVTVELFHGEGCPHCAAERAWLEELAAEHPGLRVEQHEVWYDEGNRALLAQRAADLGFEPSGVPVTVVGDRVWIGFGPTVAADIESVVVAALHAADTEAVDAGASPAATPAGQPETSAAVELPLAGSVDLAGSSLLVSTLVIGFADGINPCSLWVLAVLLAVVLHSGSRGRVAIVGSTFLLVTAGMYGLYIVGAYSALDYVGKIGWIRGVVAAAALALGLLQLKDGVAPGTGPSLAIPESRRPRLYRAMRGVARADRGLLATLAGTATLAVGVSLLETPCTAGLPLLWTSMLADQAVPTATAVALFAVYMAAFLVDEALLFGGAVVTMRARRLQPGQGRALKIVAGSLLVTLAATMLLARARWPTSAAPLRCSPSRGCWHSRRGQLPGCDTHRRKARCATTWRANQQWQKAQQAGTAAHETTRADYPHDREEKCNDRPHGGPGHADDAPHRRPSTGLHGRHHPG